MRYLRFSIALLVAICTGAVSAAQSHYLWPYNDPEHDQTVHVLHSGVIFLGEAAARKTLTYSEPPVFPSDAYPTQSATIRLSVMVDQNGSVKKAHAFSGPTTFTQAAEQAVKQWKFTPFQWNGRATSFLTQITVRFQAPAVNRR